MWLPNNTQHTSWGSMRYLHSSSLTCPKNSTASHTTSSGILTKETLSMLLGTRLPAGRQDRNELSSVSVPFPDLNIFDNPCITQLVIYTWVGIICDHYYIYHCCYTQWLTKWTAITTVCTQYNLYIY